MTVAARRLVQRWDRMPDGATVDAVQEMSALSLEIAGRALFGADLTGDAEEIRRSMSTGQRAAIAATLLPIRWGPRSTRMLGTVIHRIARTPEGVDGIAHRAADPPCPPHPPLAVTAPAWSCSWSAKATGS
jgi:hypothetical protein